MKKSFYRSKTVQLLCVFLLCTPIQVLAEIRIAACFTGDSASFIPSNDSINFFTEFPKCFEIEAINFSVQNQIEGEMSGSGGSGIPFFDNLEVIKNVDIASPSLFLNLVLGNVYDSAIFIFFDVDERVRETMRLELKQVFTVGIDNSTIRGDSLSVKESISFKFSEIKTIVKSFDEAGNASGSVSACWNLINREVC